MKRKKVTKMVGFLLTAAMLSSLLAGCGGTPEREMAKNSADTSALTQETENEPSGGQEGELTGAEKYPEFLTIEVFSSQSNYQGLQSGWFANIIAPNVAGGGDTLYQTRSANGNLGDIILTNLDLNRLKDLVQAELVLDMTDYIDNCENLKRYLPAIQTASALAEKEGLWGVPSSISLVSATEPGEISEPTGAPSIRWDLYKQAGYPEIKSLDELLSALKQMQDLAGKSDSGKDVYAISLFADWDGSIMQNAGAFFPMYGYDHDNGYGLLNVITGETQNMLADDSLYVAGLKFLFKANQMGLVDPESTTQNYDTLYAKYQDGAVLYTIFPWLGANAYNTDEHTSQGKGFAMAEIKDQKIRNWGCYSLGNSEIVAMVGSKAKDPQRMVDFLDWLYSPEGIACGRERYCGPENVLWEMKDGQPVLTELGTQAFFEGDATMPDEYGGGSWKDGSSQLSYKIVSDGEVNPENGVIYNPVLWDSYQEKLTNPVVKDWQEKMGASTTIDFLEQHDQIMTSPGVRFAPEADYKRIFMESRVCGKRQRV